MNACNEMLANDGAVAPARDAIQRSVRQLLASPAFAKAPRMCHLLSFLVEKKLGGREHELTEYAIGLEVFRRDARLYDTALDPVVRVQIGRLRERLAAYYAAPGAALEVQVTLPLGSYVPCVRAIAVASSALRHKQLQLMPLRNLTWGQDNNAFVCGVNEELGLRLFHAFGSTLQLCDASPVALTAQAANAWLYHRLEGSIRVEKNHVRASMRLVDGGAGHIAWLSQFDRSGELGMALQEELAGAICDALRHHLAYA